MRNRLLVLAALIPASLGVVGITSASAEPKPSSVTIGAHDFAFDAPPTMPGGTVKVTLDNTGAEVHQIDFIKLDPGVDQAAFTTALAANLQGSQDVAIYKGGPNSAAAGKKTSATQTLAPGNYLIACLLPGPDGVPHIVKGMVQPITVTKPAAKAPTQAKPKTTPVRLEEYDFDTLPKFDGSGTIDIVNKGKQIHELVVGKLQDGKSIQDVIAWGSQPLFQPNPYLQPYDDVGGITGISPGAKSRIKLGKLSPGDYGLFCFIPNDQGVSHIADGMVYPFTVG